MVSSAGKALLLSLKKYLSTSIAVDSVCQSATLAVEQAFGGSLGGFHFTELVSS